MNKNTLEFITEEINNYKPLFSTRKKMQQLGYEYAVEHMKMVATHIIKMKMGETNGNHTKLQNK